MLYALQYLYDGTQIGVVPKITISVWWYNPYIVL